MRNPGHARLPTGAGLALLLVSAACATTPTPVVSEPALADLEAIEETLYRYTRGLDRLDADLYVSSLTPDGAVVVYDDVFQGHDALRAIIADEAELRRTEPRTLFHLETNSRIELLAPDRALHRAYWLTLTRTGEGPEAMVSILGSGDQIDELRKIDGEWLIVRREILMGP